MIRLLIIFAFTMWTLSSAWAAPSDLSRAKRSLGRIKAAERGLSVAIRNLSEAERSKLKRNTRGLDSDGDRLADVLEPHFGASRCDADSDDDGIDDNNDRDEDNDDSDGDGTPDGQEVEVKGFIQSFSDPILIVGTVSGQITSSTRFYKGLSSTVDLVPGTCVEAEGRRDAGAFIIEEIKRESSSSCRRGSGGDDD